MAEVKEYKAKHRHSGEDLIVYPHRNGGYVDSRDLETRYDKKDLEIKERIK